MTDSSFAFEPKAFAGDIQSIPGVTSFLGAPTAQGFIPSSRALYWTTYQGGDDVVLTRGKHSIKFGAEFERMQDNEVSASNINGLFRFDSLTQFLTNQPSLFSGTGTPLPLDIGLRESLFGAYVEDDIKAKKTLTLNAGVRYEMLTVPTEAHGQTAVLPSLSAPAPICGVAAAGCAGTGPLFANPTLRNFEPRLGFAWNPRGGKTLFRGGFGIFDVLPLPYEFTLTFQRAAPFTRTIVGENPAAGSFSMDPVAGSLAYQQFAGQPDTNLAYYADPHPKRNYVMQWNLSVARELTSTLALTVGYVGSRGVHQPYRVDNIDMVLPTLTSAGYLWPCGPDRLGDTRAGWFPSEWPTDVPAQGSTRILGGSTPRSGRRTRFTMPCRWTWPSASATAFNSMAPTPGARALTRFRPPKPMTRFRTASSTRFSLTSKTTRGLSDFNVAQTLVLSATWELPGPRKDSKLPEWAFGGWQLVALYKASTGQPFTPILGGDPAGTKLDETGEVPSIVPGCKFGQLQFQEGSQRAHLHQLQLLHPAASDAGHCRPVPALRPVSRKRRHPRHVRQSPRQPGPQHRHRAGTFEAGLLRLQEQLHPAHFGKFQRAVPRGDFQYFQSRQFFLADRQPGRLRSKRAAHPKRGTHRFHADHLAPDSVRAEINLVSGIGFSLWGLVLASSKTHRLKPVGRVARALNDFELAGAPVFGLRRLGLLI